MHIFMLTILFLCDITHYVGDKRVTELRRGQGYGLFHLKFVDVPLGLGGRRC